MQVVEVIPFRTFRERLAIMKRILGTGYIEVEKNYIYLERLEGEVC